MTNKLDQGPIPHWLPCSEGLAVQYAVFGPLEAKTC